MSHNTTNYDNSCSYNNSYNNSYKKHPYGIAGIAGIVSTSILPVLFSLLFFLLLPCSLPSQAPLGAVYDAPLLVENTVVLTAEGVKQFLLDKEKPLQQSIASIQQFFFNAETIVSASVKNLRMIRYCMDTSHDINELYQRAIDRLQDNDRDIIERWKHIEILFALTREATAAFELLDLLLQDDALTINDKGRVLLIERVYLKIRRIKAAMRTQIRRINKEIFLHRRQHRQLHTYITFFS